MSGRKPIKVYVYNRVAKRVARFDSIADLRSTYFSDVVGVVPLLKFKKDGIRYDVLPNGNYYFDRAVRRKIGGSIIKRHESPYCTDLVNNTQKIVQVFNLDGKLLLEARNQTALYLLSNIPQATISQQLSKGVKTITTSGLIIKYKDEADRS